MALGCEALLCPVLGIPDRCHPSSLPVPYTLFSPLRPSCAEITDVFNSKPRPCKILNYWKKMKCCFSGILFAPNMDHIRGPQKASSGVRCSDALVRIRHCLALSIPLASLATCLEGILWSAGPGTWTLGPSVLSSPH